MKTKLSRILLAGVLFALPVLSALARQPSPTDFGVRRYVEPEFPLSLRLDWIIEGYSQIVILVGPDGKVTESFVTDFSHPAFGTNTTRAVGEWEFTTSRDAVRRVCLRFDFRREGVVVSTTTLDELMRRISRMGYNPDEVRSYPLGELDKTPEPLAIGKPVFPAALTGSGKSGFVGVAFYIDETGAVQVPSAVDAEHPEFGAAAVAAVRGWKFQPPLKNGKPTRAFVVQEFAFGMLKKAQ